MHTIFVPKRSKLHTYKRIQRDESEVFRSFAWLQVRRRVGIFWSHLFVSEKDMDRVASFPCGVFEKNFNPG